MHKACPECGRDDFTSKSGMTLHIKSCRGEVIRETGEMQSCQKCGRSDFTSRSGRTLHIKTCKGKPEVDEELPVTKGVYTLDIYAYVKAVDPRRYFISSGEAVAKAEQLEKDLWHAAGQARKLVKILRETRAEAKYLETSWEDSELKLRKKNPRKKKKKK